MTQRPLMQTGIESLERLFRGAKDNAAALAKIEAELGHRSTERAASLLRQVRLAQRRLAQKGEAGSKGQPAGDPDLFDTSAPLEPRFPDEELEVPRIIKMPQPPAASAPIASSNVEAMSVDEAYRVLKVTASSTWEAIEQVRREMVQKASPEKFGQVSQERRASLLAEAKKANTAYRVLAQVRS